MFFYCAQETRTNVRPSFATNFVRFFVEPRWGSLFLTISTQCALCDTGLWSGTALQFIEVRLPLNELTFYQDVEAE